MTEPRPIPPDREGLDNHSIELLLAARLGPRSTYLDIGANEGRFLWHALRHAPHGRHHAREPIPGLAAVLRERFPAVEVHATALADRAGRHEFVEVLDDPGYSGLRERSYPAEFARRTIEVELERLDDALDPGLAPDFVKIDVEGAEALVLEGAVETLSRHRPWVVIEHAAEVAYGGGSERVWDILAGEARLTLFDLDGGGPLDRVAFAEAASRGHNWNWFARPVGD